MEKKSADELVGGERHDFLLIVVTIILPVKTHPTVVEIEQARSGRRRWRWPPGGCSGRRSRVPVGVRRKEAWRRPPIRRWPQEPDTVQGTAHVEDPVARKRNAACQT